MKILQLISLFLLLSVAAIAAVASPDDDPRAQEILKQARTAIGGVELLQTVQAITIKGEYRRVLGDSEMTGER